jgi:hypothetical protein
MALVGERLVPFATPCLPPCKKPKACATTHEKIKSRNWPSNEKGLGEHIWFNRITLYHQNHTFCTSPHQSSLVPLHLQQPFAYKASLKPPPPSPSSSPSNTVRHAKAAPHPHPHPLPKQASSDSPPSHLLPYHIIPTLSSPSKLASSQLNCPISSSWKVGSKVWFCLSFFFVQGSDRDRDRDFGEGRGEELMHACSLAGLIL